MQMDNGARVWMERTARKHFWRVCRWYDLDDLVQDGYVQWQRVCNKYPDVTNRAHFMRLFMVTYTNHIHGLASFKKKQNDVCESDLTPNQEGEAIPLMERLLSDESDYGSFMAMIKKAPEPITKLLSLMATEDGRNRLAAVYRRRANGTRETTNERLCRLTGCDASTDFEEVFREYFATAA
jgi:hypothetical protein